MSRTVFRQVSENKKVLSLKRSRSLRRLEKQLRLDSAAAASAPTSSALEEEDGVEATPVIEVTVVLLHTNVSALVHRHLSSRLPDTTASNSCLSIVTLGENNTVEGKQGQKNYHS